MKATPRPTGTQPNRTLLDETLVATPDDAQLWMMAAQVYMQVNDFDGVAEAARFYFGLAPESLRSISAGQARAVQPQGLGSATRAKATQTSHSKK